MLNPLISMSFVEMDCQLLIHDSTVVLNSSIDNLMNGILLWSMSSVDASDLLDLRALHTVYARPYAAGGAGGAVAPPRNFQSKKKKKTLRF